MLISKYISTCYKTLLIVTVFMFVPNITTSQNLIPEEFCLSNNEFNLFEKVNLLRLDYEKRQLQLSSSLSYVAKAHVEDLQNNKPDTSICNLSSWSDKGDWTACCYNKYIHNPDCMWDKPKELTPYPYRGYELVTYFEEGTHVDSIIDLWSDSKEVLDMILTRGNYKKKKWVCGGVSIGLNYVSLWFGQRKDVQKPPILCLNEQLITDTIPTIITTNDGNIYYLIFGSFPNMHLAKEALREAKNNEFKYADILDKNSKIRLYLNKFGNLKEALYAKQQLPYEYREAWILKD